MALTKTDIPTFENVTAPSGDYLGFWPGYAAQHEITDPAAARKTGELASYLGRLTTHVIRENDPLRVALMPHIITREPQDPTISNSVAEWDRTLGTLNPLTDCQPDLVRAAGLLMRANFLGAPEDFQLPGTSSEHVNARFADLVLRNPWKHQGANEDLLLTAQLIHKAALLEPNETRREEMLEIAVSAYNRLYKDRSADWQNRLLAGQYQADIYFYWLGQEMRQARDDGDLHHFEELRGTAIELLQEQITDLRQIGRLLNLTDIGEAGESEANGIDEEPFEDSGWSGFMLESFAALAVRDLVYVCSGIDTAATRSVRRAFRHEDQPRNLKLKPKQSFDLVVQTLGHKGEVIGTSPVQLKLLSRRDSKSQEHKFRDMYGDIPVIAVKRCSPRKILTALDELSIAHARRQLERDQGPLARVQRLLGFALRNEARLALTRD